MPVKQPDTFCFFSFFFPLAMTNLYVEDMTLKTLLAEIWRKHCFFPPWMWLLLKRPPHSQNKEKIECTMTVPLWIGLIYSGAIPLPRTSVSTLFLQTVTPNVQTMPSSCSACSTLAEVDWLAINHALLSWWLTGITSMEQTLSSDSSQAL